MNPILQKPATWFFSDYQFKFQTYYFKILIYLFLIVKAIGWLMFYELYFGEHSFIYSRHFSVSSVKDCAFLLYANASPQLAYAFLIPLLVLCLFCLKFKRQYFIADFLIWFLVINLNNKIYPTLTGGDYLLNQFLFFNCFLTGSFNTGKYWLLEIKIMMHNFAVVAVISQVCLVYLLSALAKCNDGAWMSGTALNEITQVKHFSLHSTGKPTTLFNPLFMFLDYLIVFYQLVFPLVVWFKRIKKPFIWVGIGMHVYIALVMGIVEFSVVMLMAYIYFWPFKKTI